MQPGYGKPPHRHIRDFCLMTGNLPVLTSGQAWQVSLLQDKHIDGCVVTVSFGILLLIARCTH